MPRISCVAVLMFASAHPLMAQTYRYEAENGTLFGTQVASSSPGFSGTGYVTGFNSSSGGDHFQLQATVPAGAYELWVGYRSPFGQKGYEFQVGNEFGGGNFNQSSVFSEDRAGIFELGGGQTTLGIYQGWGYYDVDYLELRPYAPTPLLPVPPTLNNAQASLPSRQLMRYLTDQYGHKTLSGQHHEESRNLAFPVQSYLNKSGGIVPAIRSSDFMEYSPSRIQFGVNPNQESEQTIQWAQQTGGIVSMMWHWNAPTDLINQPGQEWWRGFYANATTFDLPGALANPSGGDYQLLLRDIDAIASELQKFRDAGVPVIWHPLHEAQGGWFWWGAHGPEAFKQLWELTYDRMTNMHGLDNLIWEYTIADSSAAGYDTEWYPGDHRVDMVGVDVYTDPSSSMSGEWNEALDIFNGRKMIALAETGTLPRPDQMDPLGIEWSYFSPWKGSFVDNMTAADLQATLNHEDVITLSELPVFPWANNYVGGDFNFDGTYGCGDINALVAAIAEGDPTSEFDLDGNGLVNADDLQFWLAVAGSAELGAGRVFLPGDANLDGAVDLDDFERWNANRFTSQAAWCSGDFNADGVIDISDFHLWNSHKFQSTSQAVPEPCSWLLGLLAIGWLMGWYGR